MKIISFGEIIWDIYEDKKCIGGAPFNFAAHAARHGEDVYMLSAVGNDELGKEAVMRLNLLKIHDDYVSVIDGIKTGMCFVKLDEAGTPSYDLSRDVAYDHIPCDLPAISCDVLYFGTLALRSDDNYASLSDLLIRGHFNEVFVDVNVRLPYLSQNALSLAASNATILKVSLEELEHVATNLDIVTDNDYRLFAKNISLKYDNIKCVIVTLGDAGAYAFDAVNATEHFCSAQKTEVVSTVGAGDSFSAAFLHEYMKKKTVDECLEYASKLAAFVVSNYDAVPDYDIEKIERMS